MANIQVRKETAPRAAGSTVPEWEPLRMMRSLFSWDPFGEMTPFREERGLSFSPAFEVKETKDRYVFTADVPGINEQDLSITLTANRLTVAGKREAEKQEQHESYHTYERTYGSFQRTFTLPEGADAERTQASLAHGVLTLTVPKRPEVQPRQIDVKARD